MRVEGGAGPFPGEAAWRAKGGAGGHAGRPVLGRAAWGEVRRTSSPLKPPHPFLLCLAMPVRRIHGPTGGRLTVGGLDVDDLIRVRCWKCERRCRLAPHDLIDRYPPGEVLKLIAGRDMRCRCCGCGWREMLLEVWRATHPNPNPPPNTIVRRIADEIGTTEWELRRRRDGR